MADHTDSFIDEVTADLRRDRLYHAMRRYGWIVVLLILGVVGGTAWLEYTRAQSRANAQEFGDAVLAARAQSDPAAALAAIDPAGSSGRRALAGLLTASALTADGKDAAAAQALRDLAAAIGSDDPVLRDLAKLKAVIVAGPSLGMSERDAILDELSQPGAHFELLALEQKALALAEAGRDDDAITLIRQIRKKPALSDALRRRLDDTLVVLGAPLDENAPLDDDAAILPVSN